MPYEWSPSPAGPQNDLRLTLWPYRSLSRRDFARFMGVTLALVAIPLLAVVGSAVLWGLLPFVLATIWGLWRAFDATYRSGEVREELSVTGDSAHLTRIESSGQRRDWHANRYWISVHLHPKGGPVENYITLRGGNREVEIGAFLSAEERQGLYHDLRRLLRPN